LQVGQQVPVAQLEVLVLDDPMRTAKEPKILVTSSAPHSGHFSSADSAVTPTSTSKVKWHLLQRYTYIGILAPLSLDSKYVFHDTC
jgi:hypothetical protein